MSKTGLRNEAEDQHSTQDNLVPEHIGENIESIAALERREWEAASLSQRRLEAVSRVAGRPTFVVAVLLFISCWVTYNLASPRPFDPPPFAWLEIIATILALLTTITVLVAQNRQSKMEKQRAHLDLQVNLLTEQKVTKLIHLLEELRRDLPMVKDRHDSQATALQERADTAQVISALEKVGLPDDGPVKK